LRRAICGWGFRPAKWELTETLRAVLSHDVFATTHRAEDGPWSVS